MAAVETGRISEARIDRSLKRIEAAKSRLSVPLVFDTDRLISLTSAIVELNDRLK